MSEFVASNGKRVEALEDGQIAIVQPIPGSPMEHRTWAGPDDAQALREFFLAERDTELGRWRSKANPEWVAIAEGIGVRVCNEAMTRVYGFASPALTDQYAYNAEGEIAGRVAREFFAAHPEPKPWHDAKPGDIWALADKDGVSAQYLSDQGRFFKLPLLEPREPCWQPAAFASDFTAGRRIWPEDDA